MSVIWKYDLNAFSIPDGSFILEMPEDAEILCVGNQNGHCRLWAKVDPNRGKVARKFFAVSTGNAFPEGADEYIGSVLVVNDSLVWHFYEGDI